MLLPLLLAALPIVQGSEAQPTCSADVRWSASDVATELRAPTQRVVSLFSAVSQPRRLCLPADIGLTVSYFDAAGDLICSGAISSIATQDTQTQVLKIELRPVNAFEFVRVTNLSRATALRWRTLTCMTDALTEAQPGMIERAASMRIYATTLAAFGGLATSELVLFLTP
jgi:hypothetical protein